MGNSQMEAHANWTDWMGIQRARIFPFCWIVGWMLCISPGRSVFLVLVFACLGHSFIPRIHRATKVENGWAIVQLASTYQPERLYFQFPLVWRRNATFTFFGKKKISERNKQQEKITNYIYKNKCTYAERRQSEIVCSIETGPFVSGLFCVLGVSLLAHEKLNNVSGYQLCCYLWPNRSDLFLQLSIFFFFCLLPSKKVVRSVFHFAILFSVSYYYFFTFLASPVHEFIKIWLIFSCRWRQLLFIRLKKKVIIKENDEEVIHFPLRLKCFRRAP